VQKMATCAFEQGALCGSTMIESWPQRSRHPCVHGVHQLSAEGASRGPSVLALNRNSGWRRRQGGNFRPQVATGDRSLVIIRLLTSSQHFTTRLRHLHFIARVCTPRCISVFCSVKPWFSKTGASARYWGARTPLIRWWSGSAAPDPGGQTPTCRHGRTVHN
jgi:hypothetical protein